MNKVIEKYLNKRNVWFIIMLVCVSLISIGYSALNTTLSISGTATARAKSDIRISNFVYKSSSNGGSEVYASKYTKDTSTTIVSLPNDNSVVRYTITIHNYSKIIYSLENIEILQDTNNSITFEYSNDVIGDAIAPGEDFTFDIIFSRSSSIEDNTKTLILKYVFSQYNKYLFHERILIDNTINNSTPNFLSSVPESAMHSTTDNLGTTYYFRGNVTNNYVLFGGFYWRILRINGNNSVRLIYQGTSPSGNGSISTGHYEDENKNAVNKVRTHSYVRYYYKSGNSEYSTMRQAIDSWYNNNLASYSKFLDFNVGYCNDYSTSGGTYVDGNSNTSLTFNAPGRLTSGNPTVSCDDKYYITPTVSNKGTKELLYPIGTISMDEVMLSGGNGNANTNYFLHTGTSYFTISPYEFEYKKVGVLYYYYPRVIYANDRGKLLETDVYTKHGYRPVINIASSIYYDKGTGTSSDPYILRYDEEPSYKFTLTPTPSDAKVVINVNGTTVFDGNGSATIEVKYKDVIQYTISKNTYLTYSNTYVMGKRDYNLKYTLLRKSTVLATYIKGLYDNEPNKEDFNVGDTYYTYASGVKLIDDRKAGDVISGGNIRYVGSDPNNYVYFNCYDYSNQTANTCEVWRVIGVFDGKAKLVRQTPIGKLSWASNTGITKNKWDADSSINYNGAALMNLLNPGYDSLSVNNSLYWNASSGKCYNGENLLKTDCDFTTIGLRNQETRNLISTTRYYLYAPNSGLIYSNQVYKQERGKDGGSLYDSSETYDTLPRSGYWDGKIALIYPSDHAYAGEPGSCTQYIYSYPTACLKKNWLAYSDQERLFTPSFASNKVWYANKIGTIEGHINVSDGAIAENIRPVLYLNETQEFKDGNGSLESPFQLTVN